MFTEKLPVLAVACLAIAALSPTASSQSRAFNDDGSPAFTAHHNGGPGTQAPGTLTTLFASNNGYAGNMLDFTPTYDMELTGIDINTSSVGNTATIEVWWHAGTSFGNEDSSAGWIPMGTFDTSVGGTKGTDNPTFVDLVGNGVTFEAGETYGLYVDIVTYSSGDSMRYTDGGPNTFSNAELTIVSNCGKASGGFTASTFFPRQMNTTLHYDFHAFELTATGTPGSLMTFDLIGATPNAPVIYTYAGGVGAYKRFNPFTGNIVISDLAFGGFTVGSVINSDPFGNASLPINVPAAAAGVLHVQALDGLTDMVSNVVSL